MRVARRALASRGRAAWMLPQAERGWSLEGRLWRLGMPPLGLVVVLRVYPHEEAARRRREAMLPVLQSGQYPHEKLDTIHRSDTTTIPPVCKRPKGTSPT